MSVSGIISLIGWSLIMLGLWGIFIGVVDLNWTGAGALSLLVLISAGASVRGDVKTKGKSNG